MDRETYDYLVNQIEQEVAAKKEAIQQDLNARYEKELAEIEANKSKINAYLDLTRRSGGTVSESQRSEALSHKDQITEQIKQQKEAELQSRLDNYQDLLEEKYFEDYGGKEAMEEGLGLQQEDEKSKAKEWDLEREFNASAEDRAVSKEERNRQTVEQYDLAISSDPHKTYVSEYNKSALYENPIRKEELYLRDLDQEK